MMLPSNGQYFIAGALIIVYFLLRLNISPRVTARVNPRSYLLVVFFALVSVNLYVHQKKVEMGYGSDYVSSVEQSLEELRKALPAGQRVGFISDHRIHDVSSLARFFLASSSVAPSVVEDGTAPDLVIVSMNRFDPKLIPDHLVLVRDFGHGVMLFRKRQE